MNGEVNIRIENLEVGAAPGLSALAKELLAGRRVLPTAALRLDDLDHVELRSGPAWSDPQWHEELVRSHRRWGGDTQSLGSLDLLRSGAACVVTGQQPALLLGPLYTAYKILGAIALAEELQRRHDRPVVPVFWCGGDDSDFDEVRRAWLWKAGEGPFRAELGTHLWRPGLRIGSVSGDEIGELEFAALSKLRSGAGRDRLLTIAASMSELQSLGDRAASWALHLFSGSGLVVVDARSERLRRFGARLFDRYAREHRLLTDQLIRHAQQLRADGWSTPLDDRALESGLFVLEGEVRRKLSPEELDDSHTDPAPSVLLRPLWQDQALAPVAAVLGPSELQYHAQLAPLYAALGVQAARPVPRPHLTLWPAAAPWIEAEGAAAHWLAGGSVAEHALREAQFPPAWAAAWTHAQDSIDGAIDRLASQLEDAEAERLTDTARAALVRDLELLRGRLARRGAARSGVDLERAATWLAVRGVPQERCMAAPHLWWWGGDDIALLLERIREAYVVAVDEQRAPTWVLRGGETW